MNNGFPNLKAQNPQYSLFLVSLTLTAGYSWLSVLSLSVASCWSAGLAPQYGARTAVYEEVVLVPFR